MSDVTKWKSSQEVTNLFEALGMSPKYLFSHEIREIVATQFPSLLILEAFATNEGYLALERNQSDKNEFLKYFIGGTGFSNEVGAKPWNWLAWRGFQRRADFYASLGRGNNDRIYFDKGWIAWFPEGYSTMTLVEFYGESTPANDFDVDGRIYFGESAFARMQALEVDGLSITGPDSINRWKI